MSWVSSHVRSDCNCSPQSSIIHCGSVALSFLVRRLLFVLLWWPLTKSSFFFFFNIYRHNSPLLAQYHLIPSSTKLYWPSTTKYQPVPPSTDSVPSNIVFKSQTFLCRPDEMSTVVRKSSLTWLPFASWDIFDTQQPGGGGRSPFLRIP